MGDLLAVVDALTKNAAEKVLGSAQLKGSLSSKILEALENFIERIDSASKNSESKSFNITDLSKQLPNISFSITRKNFTNDVFFISKEKEGNLSVTITTDVNQSKVTSETVAIIKIPGEVFANSSETLYSYQFRNPSLFLTETQLQQFNGTKTKNTQTVESNVLSATVLLKNIKNLTNPLVLTFRLSGKQNEAGETDCQFWNPNLGEYY